MEVLPEFNILRVRNPFGTGCGAAARKRSSRGLQGQRVIAASRQGGGPAPGLPQEPQVSPGRVTPPPALSMPRNWASRFSFLGASPLARSAHQALLPPLRLNPTDVSGRLVDG